MAICDDLTIFTQVYNGYSKNMFLNIILPSGHSHYLSFLIFTFHSL